MSGEVQNQVGGAVRATVPMLLTGLVAIGVMKQPLAEAITEPAIAAVTGIGALATFAMVMWSLWKNRPAAVVQTAAAIAPADIKVVVGPNASAAIKAVAADVSVPNVVRGTV